MLKYLKTDLKRQCRNGGEKKHHATPKQQQKTGKAKSLVFIINVLKVCIRNLVLFYLGFLNIVRSRA